MVPEELLRSWRASPATSGVFVDFDGTLSPIVDDPAAARPLPGVSEALGRLAAHYARVAVISGRPVAYLAAHLGTAAGRTRLIGLYGLERARAGDHRAGRGLAVEVSPDASGWVDAVGAAATEAEQEAPAGAAVERKGLAVTIHFRQADHLAGWAEEAAGRLAGRHGLVAHPGKKSWELRPPVDTDKGSVVEELSDGLEAVCFVGDDTGDLPAFAALQRLRDQGTATLAVAAGSAETPKALVESADLVVDGPSGVLALLLALEQLVSD